MKRQNPENWATQTKLIRGGLERSPYGETAEALYLTSGYVYSSAEQAEQRFTGDDKGYIYSRYGNPTVAMLEERLRLLEGAESCFCVASGMAAIYSVLVCQLQSGDHVVATKALFSSSYHILTNILPRFGITVTFVDGTDLDQWRGAFTQKTRCVLFETPSNPTLEIIDMAAVCDIARKAGARTIVDNVFATPLSQRPMEFGADIVIYSGTKLIDGQGRVLAGAILCSKQFKQELLEPFLRHTGPSLSPFNAWILLKGLETLALRVQAQSRNAEIVADSLAGLTRVAKVLYPFRDDYPQVNLARKQMKLGGNMIAFEVKGGKEGAFAALNRLGLIDISNNLGDTKSLITHPATTTHRNIDEEDRVRLGISDGLLRLSVGLEDSGDLISDLSQALG